MRNMSFALTVEQIQDQTKTVTRRLDWREAERGTLLCAVEKTQGLAPGHTVKRVAVIKVEDRRKEPLRHLLDDLAYGRSEVVKEGFPDLTPAQFVDMFCASHKGCTPDTRVSRIRFSYVWTGGSVHRANDGQWWSVLWVQPDAHVDDIIAPLRCGPFDNAADAFDRHFAHWPFAACLNAIDSARLCDAAFPEGFAP